MNDFFRQLDRACRDSFFRRVAGTDMIYTDSEMQTMFGPYLSEGKEDGLSVREIKLIETVQQLRTELAALKKEVEELKEFRNTRDMVNELIKASVQTGASIRGLFADITNFKKDQKEIAELQYQQEADTGTVGVLADVVDVLWEDDRRCLKHGYGDVVAKAKSLVDELKIAKEEAAIYKAAKDN